MISAFPAYSWLATLPASITVVVDGDSEALTTTDVDPRGLAASGAVADVLAATLGIVTPFCSCSAVPLFIGFLSAGVPLGVTFSFLISSPMVDLGGVEPPSAAGRGSPATSPAP